MTNTLQVKRLTNTSFLPTRGSEDAIGLDLYADLYGGVASSQATDDRSVMIWCNMRQIIGTGIAIAIPHGYYGRVAPRSGLAVKKGVDVLAGVIDADYRGQLFVCLLNTGMNGVEIKHGDRIAQLILERADMLDVQEVAELDETVRGANGIGSTGVSLKAA